MQPIKLEIFLDDRTLAGMKSAEGNIAALESFNRQMVERLQGELKQLERQYRQLQKQGLAGDRELADIQALKGVIGGLKDEIKAYEAAKRQAGETPLVAHDPAPKLNQVRMTMAQIARELPSLAMGPQMFFLAISNNIPMFTDAVSNARKEYELMTAAGKKATPVWKQVAASLFSPQTALAALITLTVVYGKEIGEWIKGLFGGKNAMDELRESMRETYEVEKEANATFVKSRFEMDRVIKSVKEFKGSKEEERKKVTELNRTYGETFGYYQTLSEWYDTLMKKSSDYIEVLVLEQKTRKWLDKAVEESDKADKLKAEGAESHRPWFGAGGKIHKFFGGGSTDQFGSDPASVAYNKKLKDIYDAEEDAQSTEALSALRDKLKEYISGAAKELRPSDLKQLQDALTNIDLKLADRKPFRELKRSMDEYANAQETVQKAQEDLNTVMAGGKVITGLYRDETGKLVTGLLTQEQAEKKLAEAQENRRRKRTAMAQSLQGVAGEMSSYGQAADDVVSMLEGFGVSVDENAKRVIEGFNTMSEGIGQFANSMLSGDIGGMISGVVNTAGGFVKTLGSLFGTDWGGQRSERRYQQAKERYESYMAVLDKVIAKQKELVASMETDTLANANNSYKKAGELLQQQEEYAREMGKAYLNAGASKGFLGIGSKASHGTKQREGISSTAWEQARRVLGSDFSKVADGRMTGLFDLSYEKLVELRDEATGFWSELHEDTRKYLEQIIESEEAWQEVQETRKEAMTGISFESVRSSFLDMLMDMDSSTADFADNFEKYMQKAMLNSMLSESYNGRLREWYDSFAEAMEEKTEWRTGQGRRGRNRYKVTTEAAGVLSQTEYDALKDSWNSIVSDALAERDAMKEIFGWQGDPASSQSGRSGAFTTMTQEQGTLLEGLFTSLQDHASGMHKLLEELAKSRKEDHDLLVSIAENTAYCRYLESINEIMEYFRNNGIEVS